jgi:four helix bundle protein
MQTNHGNPEYPKQIATLSEPARPHWRFQDLEIWNDAADLAVKFHHVADRLEHRKFYRYAEQLRAAGLSLPNNIAEGSGSVHKQEFIQFLNISRRSLFEDASMILVFERLQLLETAEVDKLLWECDETSRKTELLPQPPIMCLINPCLLPPGALPLAPR